MAIKDKAISYNRAGAQAGLAFLLAFVAAPGRAEELLGDAEDEYRKMIVRLSPRLARWRYRADVLHVVVRMLPGVAVRLVVLHKLWSMLG